MPITLELTRPKLSVTNAQNTSLSVSTAKIVETDNATEESFFIPITSGSIDPPSRSTFSHRLKHNYSPLPTHLIGKLQLNYQFH